MRGARQLVAADVKVDSLELAIEDLVHNRLVRGPTVPINVLLSLVAILRIVPELERSGDLVEHIALRTPQHMAEQLSPRALWTDPGDGRSRSPYVASGGRRLRRARPRSRQGFAPSTTTSMTCT